MIASMPRPRPPYLQKTVTRHGKTVWYVRRGRGPRIRAHGEYGSPEFEEAYLAALAGEKPRTKSSAASGTLFWLIERYKESAAWSRLSPATQSQRANIYKVAGRGGGDAPYASITKALIIAGRDRRRATPFAANDFLKAMRALFQWAEARGFVKNDPTAGVNGFGHKTEGFHCWTDHELDLFEARWPLGTRERLAFAILLYTGLRRGDAAMLGRQHMRMIVVEDEGGGTRKMSVFRVRTAKTGAVVEIPILPPLAEAIRASTILSPPSSEDAKSPGTRMNLAFIATTSGAPMTKESFGNWFREACLEAGVPGAAHGLRKAGATRAANNGATEAELEALFGWRGGRMASIYTRNANRAALARRAIWKMEKVK